MTLKEAGISGRVQVTVLKAFSLREADRLQQVSVVVNCGLEPTTMIPWMQTGESRGVSPTFADHTNTSVWPCNSESALMFIVKARLPNGIEELGYASIKVREASSRCRQSFIMLPLENLCKERGTLQVFVTFHPEDIQWLEHNPQFYQMQQQHTQLKLTGRPRTPTVRFA